MPQSNVPERYFSFPKRPGCGDWDSVSCARTKQEGCPRDRRARSARVKGRRQRMASAGHHPPGTRPRGVWRGRRAAQPAHARPAGGHAPITAVLALRYTVTQVLRPSFSRRSRDHGRSSRETDQDQDRRCEAGKTFSRKELN
ncbi:tubulin-specific chaperone A isoform X2 [Sapajus apella]|uniref:Tubulin-specific chaperone A isoform X2 n=1 Tax=Sapajus apella TaxID=9515 RepID=A0A6J3HU69_SAPAP|nr:tubulin-specific chaperone A isoform X2 [Sapajus apella]